MNDMQTTFRAGHIIRGQYTVIDLLGQGVSGAVYLVEDERNSQKIFVLKEVMHAIRKERRGFLFDAAVLKRLNHPALPSIYRVFRSDNSDRFYILMDYVEGDNLEIVRQSVPGKRFSLSAAMTLMSPIMDAVSYLHRQHPHLIHGDIKPSNIIAVNAGTPAALVDFGGIRDLRSDTISLQSTLNYRAPEQYGGRTSRRSDVYALGATFYTLLTGTVPAAAFDRLARIGEKEPDPLLPMNQIAPFVRPGVASAISCALSMSRHDRFATVEQFREALWQVIYDDPVVSQIVESPMSIQSMGNSELDVTGFAVDIPALFANSITQTEATSSRLPFPPAIPGEERSPIKESSQAQPHILRRKKRRLPAIGRTAGKYKRNRFALKSQKRKARRWYLIALVFLLVCVVGSGVAFAGYQTYDVYKVKYQNDVALAQVGIKHLQTALSLMQTWSKKPLNASSLAPEQREFTAASTAFTQLDSDLQSFSGISRLIPVYGTRLSAVLHVVPLAMKISQAGIVGCDALNVILAWFHEPFSAGHGLTMANLAEIGTDLHQIEAIVNQSTTQVNALQPGDLQLDARVGKAVAAFHAYLPSLQALLRTADQLLPVLPALLGIDTPTPANYLVEILDSTELRPGGGFIRDYAYAQLQGGRLNGVQIADVYLLDTGYIASGRTLSYPPAYRWFDLASKSWSLRDSNLDADFPTAAGYAEQNYSREGGPFSLQGVIAITPTLMEHALALTGPISVPELHEVITAQNLIDRIHHYDLVPGNQGGNLSPNGHFTQSRYFTELLAQYFLARIHKLRSSVFPQLFQLLLSSLHSKDLQIYFNASPAENLLRLSHVDAALQASIGDSFYVVDANMAGDNANQFITNTLDDQVTIDGSGNATHHTTIRYAWLKNGSVYGSPLYRDYVRIYVPPGSTLQEQQGWQPRGASRTFGREVWAGFLTLSYSQTLTITLTWTERGIAKKDAAGWHYQYLIQRQAGAQWILHVQITLPSCVVRTHTSGGLISRNSQTKTLTESLTEDTNLGIDYSC